MLGGARRPSPHQPLIAACRAVNALVRFQKKMAKKKPHLYGAHTRQYFLDTIALDHQRQEISAALNKVYCNDPSSVSTVWSERYPEFADQAREDLKTAKLVKKR